VSSTNDIEQRCSYHPDVTTGLRCTRCGKPICPRCMVPSPVGYRCPDCARSPKSVLYQASAGALVIATALGLLVATGVGLLWGAYPEWQFYLCLLLGFGVAETMAWSVGYKRGRELQVAAMACVFLGLIAARFAIAAFDDVLTVDMLLNNASDRAVAERFQLELLPDFLFAAIPFGIVYIRFK
jgi:hypothetical protein